MAFRKIARPREPRRRKLPRADVPPELKPEFPWEHDLLGPIVVEHVGATAEGRLFVNFRHVGRAGGGSMYVEHFLETARPAAPAPPTG